MSQTAASDFHVVVTCSSRKSQQPPVNLQIRSFGHGNSLSVGAWVERLTTASTQRVASRDLYAGEHWQVVRSIERHMCETGRGVQLWVCSAGYGLVDLDAQLHPYSATFASAQPDSVAADQQERQRWWNNLAAWDGPVPGQPRLLAELARRNPKAQLVVAASPSYISACGADLADAANELRSPDQLSIISIGARTNGHLSRHVLPADARVQSFLGGTRGALNVRLLAHLLTNHDGSFTTSEMSATTASLIAGAPALVRYDRKLSTDREVAAFIRRRLRVDPSLSHSRLLREYRDRGRACEQARFGTIFKQVQENLHALDN